MTLNKQENNRLIIFNVIVLSMIGMISTDIYVPSMLLITKALGTTSNWMKLTITAYLLGFSISPLLFGHLSDRIGRKPILLSFACIALIGILVSACSVSIDTFILGRIIQGVGFGIVTAIARTIFIDLFQGVKLIQISSLVSFFIALGPAVAPILGGYIQVHLGWRAIFLLLCLFLLIMIILALIKIPETVQQKNIYATKLKSILTNYKTLCLDQNFLTYATCSSMSFSGLIVFFTLSPFILQTQYHLTILQYAWTSGLITLMNLLSRVVNIVAARYVSPNHLILFSLCSMLISSCALLCAAIIGSQLLSLIIIAMMCFILGAGIIFANASACALGPFRHIGGIAGAFFGSLQTFGAFFAGLIVSHLHNNLLTLACALSVISFVALFPFLKTFGISFFTNTSLQQS